MYSLALCAECRRAIKHEARCVCRECGRLCHVRCMAGHPSRAAHAEAVFQRDCKQCASQNGLGVIDVMAVLQPCAP